VLPARGSRGRGGDVHPGLVVEEGLRGSPMVPQLRSVERRRSICGATGGRQRGEDAHLGVVMEEGFGGRRRCRQWRRTARRWGIGGRGAEFLSMASWGFEDNKV
jgi:hypothetical protein